MSYYSEKPDEYSKPSESCQANETFEDSLCGMGLKICPVFQFLKKIKESLEHFSSGGELEATFFWDRQNSVEENSFHPYRNRFHH